MLIYTYLAVAFLKIPGLIYYFFNNRRLKKAIEPVFYYLLFSALCDLYLLITSRYGIRNLNAINIIHLLDCFILLWFYSKIKKNDKYNWLNFVIAGIFTVCWIYENFIYSDINSTINYYTVYLIAFYFSFVGADYLISKTFATDQKVTIDANFIFVCGFFIFVCIDLITLPFIIPKSEFTEFYYSIDSVRKIGFIISQVIYNYCIYLCLLKTKRPSMH